MLYVAIWYVSIRLVVMRAKEELQFCCCYEGEGRTAVLLLL